MTSASTMALHRTGFRQIGRFAATGVANTALGLALILIAHEWLGMGLLASNLIGYGAGLGLSFVLNRRWTFGHRGPLAGSMIRFAAVILAGFGASLLVTAALTGAGYPFVIAQVLGVLSYSILTFLGFRHVVFPDRA